MTSHPATATTRLSGLTGGADSQASNRRRCSIRRSGTHVPSACRASAAHRLDQSLTGRNRSSPPSASNRSTGRTDFARQASLTRPKEARSPAVDAGSDGLVLMRWSVRSRPTDGQAPRVRVPDVTRLPIATSLSMALSMNRGQDKPQMTVPTADAPACDAVDSGVGAKQRTCKAAVGASNPRWA
jgi:hypothetical protein